MIRHIIGLLLFTVITYSFKIAQAQQPANWRMQSVQLQTRWAKEVSPKNTLNSYPRPQMVRNNWTNLNGLWDYAITDLDQNRPKQFEDQILVPYPIESALSGVKKVLLPTQNLWYKKTFNYAELNNGNRLLLHFGAVDWQTTVFVNGEEVGGHTGGYTAFTIDITDRIKPGENELLVKVFDPTNRGIGPSGKQVLSPQSIYYTSSSGIWQTVWLEQVPALSFKRLILTPDIDQEVLNVGIEVNHPLGEQTKIAIEVAVYAKGKQVANKKADAQNGQGISFSGKLKIPKPHLWSPADPFLYDLVFTITQNGKIIDQVKSYCGMRKVDIQKDEKGIDRIYLNNKFVYQLGTLDQGFWPDGLYTAPTDEALAFDIKAIKAMGFNTIRKHIKVEPDRWYYYADKLGMIVWQDMVNPNQALPEGSKPEFEKESAEILKQLHNFPCITTWILFNEKWGQYDQERLTKWVKAEDPSRIVNGHSGELLYVDNKLRSPSKTPYIAADLTDVHSYPNPRMSEKKAGKAQVCGEFGGIGVSVPYHEWNDISGWGYVQKLPTEFKKEYNDMVDSLVKLKQAGLSASIYTQPFDVEGEENGIMTYDRKIVKIPFQELRRINGKLNSSTPALTNKIASEVTNIDPTDNDTRYNEFVKMYNEGKIKDSTTLRRITLMAARQKDELNLLTFGNSFINAIKTPLTTENIKIISFITRSPNSNGYKIFNLDKDKINQLTYPYFAENKIKSVINSSLVVPYTLFHKSNLDWDSLAHAVQMQFGELGSEEVYGSAMAYYWDHQGPWEEYGKYYAKHFQTAYARSKFHTNNMSWAIFEHVKDKETLKAAVNVMKYAIENRDSNNIEAYDTYANLLYKTGDVKSAIEWEKKAVNAHPDDKYYKETLEKMINNVPTWK